MPEKSRILCYGCNNPIKSKEDLVTANYFVFVRAYHSLCYSKGLKSLQTIFLKNYPINGFRGTLAAIISPLIGILIVKYRLFTSYAGIGILIFILTLYPLFIRIYSYIKFEKRLN